MTGSKGTLPRCKPFKYTYEKEIVMYGRVSARRVLWIPKH
jgi:hypothetical protein